MMDETPNLKLTLSPSSGWSEQYYEDFINIIDTEVGGVKDTLTAVENALAEI